jgi:hypothetical protein
MLNRVLSSFDSAVIAELVVTVFRSKVIPFPIGHCLAVLAILVIYVPFNNVQFLRPPFIARCKPTHI